MSRRPLQDAYAQIKLLNRDYGLFRFRIVANMVRTPQEGTALFNKLTKVTDRFLEVALQYAAIPQDDALKRAVQRQKAGTGSLSALQSGNCLPGPGEKSRLHGRCLLPPVGIWNFSWTG